MTHDIMSDADKLREKRNTLSLEGMPYHRLLEKLDETGNRGQATSLRIFRRLEYRHAKLVMYIESEGHNQREIIIATRNLSQGGLSILHSSFMYPGTKVTVDLIDVDHSISPRRGTVKRCQHCGGRVHEVGIQFDEEVNLRNFLHPNRDVLLHSREKVDPARMDVRFLVFSNNTEFSALMRQYMLQTNLIYSFSKTEDEALTKCDESDMVMCFLDHTTMQTPDTIRQMRDQGFTNPIILVGQPKNTIDSHIISACGADMVVPWPSDEQTILCSIGEYIFNDWTSESLETIRSCISSETQRILCMELAKLGVTLDQQIRTNNTQGIHQSSSRIRSLGQMLGLGALKATIDDLIERNAIENDFESLIPEFTEIASICKSFSKRAA